MNQKAHLSQISEEENDAHQSNIENNNNENVSLNESRTIFCVGEIDEDLMKSCTESMIEMAEKNPTKPITLIVSTHGGDVDELMMLYDIIKYIPNDVHTVGLGKIMSAGCLLLASGKKGKRRMGRNARMMYHLGWDIAFGSIFEIKASMESFERQEEQYDKLFAEETGRTIEEVRNLYGRDGPKRDTYLTAQQALEFGIIDEII